MEEIELISKKELLQLTGISYGQLYRWKRENLIPESWFIKKSSFTGQETYFPKEKVLKRTAMILELKDKYSLEELAKILSPELTNQSFHMNRLQKFTCFDAKVIDAFRLIMGKEYFTFIELIFMYIISRCHKELNLSKEEIECGAVSIKDWIPKLKDNNYNLILFGIDEKRLMLLIRRDVQVLLDSRASIINSIDMEEASKDLNLMLNNETEGIL